MKTKLLLGVIVFAVILMFTPTTAVAGQLEPDTLTLAAAENITGAEVYTDLVMLPVTVLKGQENAEIRAATKTCVLPKAITEKYDITEVAVVSTLYKTFYNFDNYSYAKSLYNQLPIREQVPWESFAGTILNRLPYIHEVKVEYQPDGYHVNWSYSTEPVYRALDTGDTWTWYLPAVITWYGIEKGQTKSLAHLNTKLEQ